MHRTPVTLTLALVGVAAGAHAQTITYDVVLQTGTRVPGLPFAVVPIGLGVPSINQSGDVALTVELGGVGVNFNNDSALVAFADGVGRTIAREGDQLPGAPLGKQFNRFWLPAIGDGGGVTFASDLRDSGVANGERALHSEWGSPGGPLNELARTGLFAEDFGEEAVSFGADLSNSPFTNSAGTAYYTMTTDVFFEGEQRLFRFAYLHEPGASRTPLSVFVPSGAAGYDPALCVNFNVEGLADTGAFYGLGEVSFDLAGQVLSGPGGGVLDDDLVLVRAVLDGASLDLEIIAAREASAGVGFRLDGSESSAMNRSGDVVFTTDSLSGGETLNEAIFFCPSGGGLPQRLVRENDSALFAIPPILFDSFGAGLASTFGVGIGNDSTVVFEATLRGESVVEGTDTGVFTVKPGGAARVVAREGSLPPDAVIGVAFDSCSRAIVNGRGQVAMSWSLRGPFVSTTNDAGIYATDRNGVLHAVLREGQAFDLSDDPMDPDVRTVGGVTMIVASGASGNAGERTPFNDEGKLAMRVSFTDGTEAIVIAHIDPLLSLCSADFDMDFDVDLGDFGLFGGAFGSVKGDPTYAPEADLDGDGDVDLGDFGDFGAQFGNGPEECAP